MRKLSLSDILPHALAIVVFLLVTVMFFSPIFFENRALSQNDITQFVWGTRELRDYRAATGEEGLWSNAMFSGMPAYLVNLDWNDGVVVGMKKVLSLFLPHPVCNIFLAIVCYYILLLSFRIRPALAIAGALAFGLSSYMVIGLAAGHNARIGAIAFMPLVVAGIHLAFTGKRITGLAVTAAGMALHLRENHLQITYYLLIMVIGYGVVQLAFSLREKKLGEFFKTVAMLGGAVAIAAGTFFGPLWAISEFSQFSTRGKSELITTSDNTSGSGLPKSYAFEFSNGILEPMTGLIPNFYGGSSFSSFMNDEKSNTYQALVRSGDQNMANQLSQYTSSYWGPQRLSAPYYEGAMFVFLFVLGIFLADKKYVIWLTGISVLALMMSWGSNFEAFNYFLFDHLPGYNKFRSVTFVMVIVFFSLPLLGMLGLESLLQAGTAKEIKRKILIAFGATGGLCLLFFLAAGMLTYLRPSDLELPPWFLRALQDDRRSMFRTDALRSFMFILPVFILLYFDLSKKISSILFFGFIIVLILIDVTTVDRRYFTKENYQRKRDMDQSQPNAADQAILKDKSSYRVFNLLDFYEAGTSQFHQSLGGYHGVRIKRYQELYDSCITRQRDKLVEEAQKGNFEFRGLGVLNMLNVKYFVYGPEAGNVILNPSANGNAWFAREVRSVNSPNEELINTCIVDTKSAVVVDASKFKVELTAPDSMAVITLTDKKPSVLKYESQSATDGLAVFSEIYYPRGWHALIDGKEVPILRVNYVLRGLVVPAGKHAIEFRFEPKPYTIGNTVTMASGWVLLILVLGAIGWNMKAPVESGRDQSGEI